MKKNEPTIELDSELYERLAIWSMQAGQDDVNEFVNNLLLWGLESKEVRRRMGLRKSTEK
jgi:hypothetical protein